ncbi:hypothetical protein ACFQAS_03120 [Halopenitus salinus]|uniref:Uncharacterized protein n=1 Tax=Halopenitus salinus TaxID=1198295 RepID=A0ABD5URI9_9EURY
MSSFDEPTADDLRSRSDHAVRAAWYLVVVTVSSGVGVWILHRFELGALVDQRMFQLDQQEQTTAASSRRV